MPDISAANFASALYSKFDATRARGHETATAGQWSQHVFPLLAEIAEANDLWWAGLNTGRHRPRHGESREYLWDFTLYAPDEAAVWNMPRVIIEHENVHDLAAFRYDHWKTLLGIASLRVAIGYVSKPLAEKRHEWVDAINAAVEPNGWQFPPDTEDLIALGYYGMTEGDGNYKFWCRRGDARAWTAFEPTSPSTAD